MIAVGVRFSDGSAVLRWNPPSPLGGANPFPPSQGSTAVWPSLAALRATHLHPRSNTTLVWVD